MEGKEKLTGVRGSAGLLLGSPVSPVIIIWTEDVIVIVRS